MSTLLAELRYTQQDHEWYPTTNEIINAFHQHAAKYEIKSILDIGAGNGKVLNRFKELSKSDRENHIDLFAIEKSRPLLDSLPMEIGILGTDFWEQSLLDKSVECIFTNPPYSEFIDWAVKVIREANSTYIYMVVPQRWKDQKAIMDAIKSRQAGYEVIGSFDFMNSEDRTDRAKVDLIHIWLCHDSRKTSYRHNNRIETLVDPFELWVKEFFALDGKQQEGKSDYAKKSDDSDSRKAKLSHSLVTGKGMIEVLDELYREELGNLINNYQKVSSLDQELFKELDISVKSIIASIKSRVEGLKNAYWQELFRNYEPLTSRLTASSRKSFIGSISRKTNIDFTASNAYAITVWAIKNADQYLDSQMIDTFNTMVEAANVVNYKSNERVFKKNTFRYNYDTDKHTHFKLDYRIVVERMGGLVSDKSYNKWSAVGGLSEHAANFIDDLLVVARNLGFNSDDEVKFHNFESGSKEEFYCTDKSGKECLLMTVRAYLNGNLHIKFNQAFMLALNVEIGRLQGWIHNAQQAAEEMGEKPGSVSEYFNSAYSLKNDSIVLKLIAAKY